MNCPKCERESGVVLRGTSKELIKGIFYKLYACLECGNEWNEKPEPQDRQNWNGI